MDTKPGYFLSSLLCRVLSGYDILLAIFVGMKLGGLAPKSGYAKTRRQISSVVGALYRPDYVNFHHLILYSFCAFTWYKIHAIENN